MHQTAGGRGGRAPVPGKAVVVVRRGREAFWEIGMVLAVAGAGLVLAGLAAFAPWYDAPRTVVVVDLRSGHTVPADLSAGGDR